MKIHTNELGHMANMAAMPIYGKRSLRFQSQNLFFAEKVWRFETKIHMKA